MPTLLIGEHHGIDIGQREEPGHQQVTACVRVLGRVPPLPDRRIVLNHLLPDWIEQIAQPDLRISPQREHQGSSHVACQAGRAKQRRRQQAAEDQQHEKREGKQQPSANADHPAGRTLLGGDLRWHHVWTAGVHNDITDIVAQIQEGDQPGMAGCQHRPLQRGRKSRILQDNGGPTKTMLPASGSPAIGPGTGCPPIDQGGNPRSSACTLGAVEAS